MRSATTLFCLTLLAAFKLHAQGDINPLAAKKFEDATIQPPVEAAVTFSATPVKATVSTNAPVATESKAAADKAAVLQPPSGVTRANPIPEPDSLALMALGAGMVGLLACRKSSR